MQVDRDQLRHALALDVGAAHQVARPLGRDHGHVDLGVRLDLREVDREAMREHQHRSRLEVGFDRLAEELALSRVWGEHHDDRRLGDRFGDRHRAQAVRFDPLDRLAARVEADADVLTAVAKVQRVSASLAAVADHRHRLAKVGRAVALVMDLHAVLLITTGPERTTSLTPCRFNSSTNSPTSPPSPANSTVAPVALLCRSFAPFSSSPERSDAATRATTSSRLCRSWPVRSSTSTTSTNRSSCLRTWSASACPWSTCKVSPERAGLGLGPTVIERTWKPRRRMTPETLLNVFGPSSTSTERTRTRLSLTCREPPRSR